MTTESIEIAAPAPVVWSLVSDLTRMPEWSPETFKVEWTGGSTGPSVGATFKGSNRIKVRRWSTNCRITVADPPHELAWDVHSVGGMKVAHWGYLLEELDDRRCRVTETALDHRPGWFKLATNVITGVTDRGDHNAEGMRATLERLKSAAEATTP
jgi:uncharacterized protein YndB with AHSA1/START domain